MVLAKWIRPELFKDLNPEHTFEEMNKQLGDHGVKSIFGISSFEVMLSRLNLVKETY
ncbi:hypothetical protein [uncultured Photobacterium sp.]|uniref:hypothetical protein n=1 Tax=uncultured Photobacterium sp. TaxID=173973 RepID=UPI0026112264|nr:hypothetical protein [uncultured Photobacterium sp.]